MTAIQIIAVVAIIIIVACAVGWVFLNTFLSECDEEEAEAIPEPEEKQEIKENEFSPVFEKITIEFRTPEEQVSESYIWGGWVVRQGNRYADGLTYDEMLGLVASLTMPKNRPCLQWMITKEDHEARRTSWDKKIDSSLEEPITE